MIPDTQQFQTEVYAIVREIPRGRVMTYGQIARLAGKPLCSRLVGNLLSRTSLQPELPCHRVVNSQGRTTPGWAEQSILLQAEGIKIKKNGCVDLTNFTWEEIRI